MRCLLCMTVLQRASLESFRKSKIWIGFNPFGKALLQLGEALSGSALILTSSCDCSSSSKIGCTNQQKQQNHDTATSITSCYGCFACDESYICSHDCRSSWSRGSIKQWKPAGMRRALKGKPKRPNPEYTAPLGEPDPSDMKSLTERLQTRPHGTG